MTKADLVSVVKDAAGITKDQANAAVEAFTGAVVTSMKEGNELALKGFGSFSVMKRDPRTGRNPATGEPLEIGEKFIPKFKFSKEVTKELAEHFAAPKKGAAKKLATKK